QNADDADVFTVMRQSRAKPAMPPDDQVDLYTLLRRPVQLLDHLDVVERVHLVDDPAVSVLLLESNFPAHELLEGPTHLPGRHDQTAVMLLRYVPGEVVEEVCHVERQVRITRQEPDVRVLPGRLRVVVAG